MTEIDLDELSEEEIESILNTSAFQKALQYRRLSQGIEVLKENDAIYSQMVASITQRHGSVSTQSSVEEVLDLLVDEVETYTEDLSTGEETKDLDDLFEQDA